MEMLPELTLCKAFLVSIEERIMWETWTDIGLLYKFAQCRYLVGGQVCTDAHKKQWRHSSHLYPSHCPSGNSEALRKSRSLCTARVWAETLQDSHCTHFVNIAYLPACSHQFTQRLNFVNVANSEWKRSWVNSRNESEGEREGKDPDHLWCTSNLTHISLFSISRNSLQWVLPGAF